MATVILEHGFVNGENKLHFPLDKIVEWEHIHTRT